VLAKIQDPLTNIQMLLTRLLYVFMAPQAIRSIACRGHCFHRVRPVVCLDVCPVPCQHWLAGRALGQCGEIHAGGRIHSWAKME